MLTHTHSPPRSEREDGAGRNRVRRVCGTKVQYAEFAEVLYLISMKMMDCSVLKTMVVNHKPIELIDVRSKNKFAAAHIPGARSLPFGELAAPKSFRRSRPTKQIICIISEGGHVRASVATGILRSAGYLNAIPLDGGMKDWMARGFPVRRKRFSAKARASLRTSALPLMAAAAAAALNEPIVATLLLAIAGVLLLTPKFSRGKRVRQSSGIRRKHAIQAQRTLTNAIFAEGETA